jgi:hypothetical protein
MYGGLCWKGAFRRRNAIRLRSVVHRLGRGRIFLEVVRCGSFRSAAERLELSRGRHMIDRLVEAFNPAKFPWFRDDSSIHVNLKRYIRVKP